MTTANEGFKAQLHRSWLKGRFLCVGLDPDLNKTPTHIKQNDPMLDIVEFIRSIIDATKHVAAAYKPNRAFYARHGQSGLLALHYVIKNIRNLAPEASIILDAKEGDIGSSNTGYAAEAFDVFGVDAITLNPYLGEESLRESFLSRPDKGCIILCLTSNAGSAEFQERLVLVGSTEFEELMQGSAHDYQAAAGGYLMPQYHLLALRVSKHWNTNGNCMLVTGATKHEKLSTLRALVPNLPFLLPGVGEQQRDVSIEEQIRRAIQSAQNVSGEGHLVAVARSILYASSGRDCVDAARRHAEFINGLIGKYCSEVKS